MGLLVAYCYFDSNCISLCNSKWTIEPNQKTCLHKHIKIEDLTYRIIYYISTYYNERRSILVNTYIYILQYTITTTLNIMVLNK